jgi:ABC-2 type transport system permease protein
MAYPDVQSARQALDAGEIQAYFSLPANYPQVRELELVYKEEPDNNVVGEMSDRLRRALLAGQPAKVIERVLEGPDLAIVTTQDNAQAKANDWVKVVVPIAAAILLMMSIFTSSGYLMQAVVEEKENRTMEILVTSISPMQLMAGKVIALIGVGLTQVLAWSLFPLLGLAAARTFLPFLQNVTIDISQIGLMLLLVAPTFIMIAALMAAIGATVTEAREGQQVSGLITMPVMLPFMLMGVLINNPGSPLALALTFFPLSSALTVLLRMAFSSVPPWQVFLSAGIVLVSAVGGLWLAGRVFRLGMLRYGQRMGWKEVFSAMRLKS